MTYDRSLEVPDVSLWCDAAGFVRVRDHDVRWLDWDRDYELAAKTFPNGLSREDFLSVRDIGFTYCGITEGNEAVARAAVWRGVPQADRRWEVAAVWTREDRRGRRMAQTVVSFVTEYIITNGRVATLHTQPTNSAMLGAATAVGFVILADEESGP